jgi:hypothetical protein
MLNSLRQLDAFDFGDSYKRRGNRRGPYMCLNYRTVRRFMAPLDYVSAIDKKALRRQPR